MNLLTRTRKRLFGVLRRLKRMSHPPGGVSFGNLRRLQPVSDDWGFDRGTPVDRYYIESFLAAHAGDIRGHTLEFLNNDYTRRFGGERVTHSDVLHHAAGNPAATLVADLTADNDLPDATFDCIICTQVLPFVYDLQSAAATLARLLKPGGVLLVTLPAVSRISPHDMEQTGDYWRFTGAAARRLFSAHFDNGQLEVETRGNVLAAIAFLHGLASQELSPAELAHHDSNFPVLVTVRAVRADSAGS